MSSSAVKPDEKNPNAPGEAPEGDIHPADEFDDSTGGERTVAQPFDAFELDPAMPLPISVPPPAMEKKEPPKTTGTQRMPPTPVRPPAAPLPKPIPRAPPPKAGAPPGKPSAPRIPLPPPPSARVPVARVGSSPEVPPAAPPRPPSVTNEVQTSAVAQAQQEPFEDDDPTNDGPTMATAPGAVADLLAANALPEEPKGRRSPLAATGFAPSPAKPGSMSDVETIARAEPAVPEQEETTRAVSREELFRAQDAHVVVGDDAIGDEATLAVPPEKFDAMKAAASAHEAPKEAAAFPPPPTPFAGPPGYSPLAQAPMPMPGGAPQSWPQAPAADAFRAGPASAPQPIPPAPYGIARNAQQAITGPAMHQQTQQPIPQPMWPPPQAQAQGQPPRSAGMKITPQILALVGVGIVCLLIFVVGLYLFFTTKF